jgi:hypothetical protein
MSLLTQLHIWKLRSCAALHARKAKALKKRLLSEIRSFNLEIREQEYRQQICSRLASRKALRAGKGKVTPQSFGGQEEPATLRGWARYKSAYPSPFEL